MTTVAALLAITLACKIARPNSRNQLAGNTPKLGSLWAAKRRSLCPQLDSRDFAECMRDLVDVHYPDATCIRVVLDNLSTHSESALYQTFSPKEARRILRKIEFHFVPKHASWLNMVEIEIGVLRGQCLNRRIEDRATLECEIAAWEEARNAAKARIKWMFNVEKARKKMWKAYPEISEVEKQKVA